MKKTEETRVLAGAILMICSTRRCMVSKLICAVETAPTTIPSASPSCVIMVPYCLASPFTKLRARSMDIPSTDRSSWRASAYLRNSGF
eukprot:958595-Pyramimonas_sp.AAC.2